MRQRRRTFRDAVIISACGVIAGGVMAMGSVFFFITIMLGDPSGFALSFALWAGVFGMVLGAVSLTYLLPLLLGSRLAVSLPMMLAVSVTAGIVFGAMHPLLGVFAAFVAQISSAAMAGEFFPVWANPTTCCPHCGYDCRGITSDTCPECGLPSTRASDRAPCGCGEPYVTGRCPACGIIDFNRVAGLPPGEQHGVRKNEVENGLWWRARRSREQASQGGPAMNA